MAAGGRADGAHNCLARYADYSLLVNMMLMVLIAACLRLMMVPRPYC